MWIEAQIQRKSIQIFFSFFFLRGVWLGGGGPLASDAIFNIVVGAIFLIVIFLGGGKRPGYPVLPRGTVREVKDVNN